MGFGTFIYNQFLVTPAVPTTPFTDQIAIITGASSGLGLETARHIARLGAKKVILAVRDVAAGEVAKKDIESSIAGPSSSTSGTEIEVWPLDLSDHTSVLSFAEKATQLPRFDTLVLNAAVATKIFKLASTGYEHSATVNTINHFLLAFLLLPKMRRTAADFPERVTAPHITVLTSQVHAWPEFPQWKDERGILVGLSDEKTAKMEERYPMTKLLNVLMTREFVSRLKDATTNDPTKNEVIINMLDTGFCHSHLSRENQGIEAFVFDLAKTLFARTAEVGARTTIASVVAGRESHGKYMVNGVVADEALSEWVRSEEGRIVGRRLWEEIVEVGRKVGVDAKDLL